MSKLINLKNGILLLVFNLVIQIQSFGQTGIDVNVTKKETTIPDLFTSPNFWIGVAIVIILVAIIIGLSRRGKAD